MLSTSRLFMCLCLGALLASSATSGTSISGSTKGLSSATLTPQQQPTPPQDTKLPAVEQRRPPAGPSPRVSGAEKLKRGLNSFVNQLNPGAYFVASQQPQQQSVGMASAAGQQLAAPEPKSSAEPAAIVDSYPTVDVLMKGPGRLAQTRSMGGTLRWGRRK